MGEEQWGFPIRTPQRLHTILATMQLTRVPPAPPITTILGKPFLQYYLNFSNFLLISHWNIIFCFLLQLFVHAVHPSQRSPPSHEPRQFFRARCYATVEQLRGWSSRCHASAAFSPSLRFAHPTQLHARHQRWLSSGQDQGRDSRRIRLRLGFFEKIIAFYWGGSHL